MNILVVEDNPYIAELLAIHLRDLPATVSIRSQGWQGLDEALSGRYDFMVLDLMLPGLSGMEICRQLCWSTSMTFTADPANGNPF